MTYLFFSLSIALITISVLLIKNIQKQKTETSIALQRLKETEASLKISQVRNKLIKQLNRQIEVQQSQLQKLSEEKEKILTKLREEISQKAEGLEQLRARLSTQNESIRQLNSQIGVLENQVSQLQRLNEEKERTLAELREEISQKIEELEQLRASLSTQSKLIQQLNNQAEVLQSQLKQLQQLNEEKEKSLTRLYRDIEIEIDTRTEWHEEKIKECEERAKELERELENLNNSLQSNQNEHLRGISENNTVNSIVIKASEHDFYPNERLSILLDVLKNSLMNIRSGSRRQHIIADIIHSSDAGFPRGKIKENLQSLFRSYTGIDSRTKRALEHMGFEIVSENTHHKIIFYQDRRYIFSFSKTPSDWRAGRNIARDLCHLIL
ncbi:MAG: hypothetical protein WBG38_03655 [Nodosilinea sp.]